MGRACCGQYLVRGSVRPTLGIVGLGRMAQALLCGLIETGDIEPSSILAVVKTAESAARLVEGFPRDLQLKSLDEKSSIEVWSAPIVLLAVKPQQLHEVVNVSSQANLSNSSPQLLISVLAGVSISSLQKAFPQHLCVRAVPNAPAFVGAGLTGLSWGKGFTEPLKNKVKSLFIPVGEVLELSEDQLDAFLALTSSGPAYIALISEALADGAVAAGLPRTLAGYLAHRTIAGTAELLNNKKLHPGQVKDMVTSPSGTTIAALRKLEKAGIRSALIEAVVAAAERSRELGDALSS